MVANVHTQDTNLLSCPATAGIPGTPVLGTTASLEDAHVLLANDSIIMDLQSEMLNLRRRLSLLETASRFRTFKRIGQKYYVTDGHVALFDGALSYCSTFGASLVLPRTNVENQALAKLTEEYPAPHSFIGTTDRKHEGQFTDLDDRPLTFTKWGSGEPQNTGSGEDCVIVIPAGTWHDVSCDSNRRVVCEISL
ncbi:mannose-binding protein C-like [Engraulis encrasicolus]|uniref:mannose-binding protein C-like n=1 Tax=Engraulis encrasicolus TaxID=184585 RepID=UPI002FD61357